MKYLYILASLSLFAGCTKNTDRDIRAASDQLSVKVSLGDTINTKSAITPSINRLGLSLYKSSSGEVYGSGTNNIIYELHSDKWKCAEGSVCLNHEHGVAYAYYPYSAEVTDLTKIPVLLDQTDHLWGRSLERNLSSSASNSTQEATVVLDHLLTRVAVKVCKTTDNEATLSSVKIRSRSKSVLSNQTSGVTYSALTGELTGVKPTPDATIELRNVTSRILPQITTEIPDEAIASGIILPTEQVEDGDLEFVFTVNNTEFTVPIPAPVSEEYPEASNGLQQRYSYTYSVQYTGASMTISGVSFIPWVMLDHVHANINNKADYKYSADKNFLYYKDQEKERKIISSGVVETVVIYSNKDLPTSDLSICSSIADVASMPVIRKLPMITDSTYYQGDKILGDWRYEIDLQVVPNLYASKERIFQVAINHNEALVARVAFRQAAPTKQILGFVQGFTTPASITLNRNTGDFEIAPYSYATSLTINLESNLIWNDCKSWTMPLEVVNNVGINEFSSFKLLISDNNKLVINTVPNVSGKDITKEVKIIFQGDAGITTTKNLRIVHKTIPNNELEMYHNMCVDINGIQWLKVSLSGATVATIPTLREVILSVGSLVYPTAASQFTENARTIIVGNPAYYARTCPPGFKNPTSQEVSQSLFNGTTLTSTFALAPVAVGDTIHYGQVSVLKMQDFYQFTDHISGDILWLPNYSYWLNDSYANIGSNRYIMTAGISGFNKTYKSSTNTASSRVRCIKEVNYLGVR